LSALLLDEDGREYEPRRWIIMCEMISESSSIGLAFEGRLCYASQ